MDFGSPALHKGGVRIVWVIVLALLFVAGGFWFTAQARQGDRELPVYTVGAERMLHGEEIYRPAEDAKAFTYPPFFALPFVPLALLPASWQPAAWFAVNLVVLLGIGWFLQRWWGATGPLSPARTAWFWLLVLLLAFRHVASVFENQSHDLLVAGTAVLVAAAWCRGSSTAGAWAGVGAACKATPLLFVLLFSWRRRWPALLLMLASAALLTLLPDLLLPRADGRLWAVAWYEINLSKLAVAGPTSGVWGPLSFLNQSLTGTVTRLCTEVAAPGLFVEPGIAIADLDAAQIGMVTKAAMLLVLAAIGLGLWLRPRGGAGSAAAQRVFGLGEVSLIVCGMLLLSPQSSKSHFCVLLLPAAFAARRLLGEGLPRGQQVLLALLLLVSALLGTGMSKGLVGRAFGNRMLACGSVTWSCVALLLATVLAMRQPAARPSTNSTIAT